MTPHQHTHRSPSLSAGELFRRCALTVGACSSIALAVMLVAAPHLMGSLAVWFVWGSLMLTLIVAYTITNIAQRGLSVAQSRRTRRWLGSTND